MPSSSGRRRAARAKRAPELPPRRSARESFLALALILAPLVLAGCFAERPAGAPAAPDPFAVIEAALPARLADRAGWAHDLEADFKALKIPASPEHVCAVVAVIEQESGFQVDPVIPGLAAIAWREIGERAARANVPMSLVHEVLKLRSPDGRSYAERIDAARTEHELSDVFEDFTGTVPLGRTLFARFNPIRTRGPMQVNVAFAERFETTNPYPFAVQGSLQDELFARRASLYFGMAHLLAYPADYDSYLYRFADYNAGQYASRNAALQRALAHLSGLAVTADGALEPPGGSATGAGETERAALALAPRLGLSEAEVHSALALGRSAALAETRLYRQVMTRWRASEPGAPAAVLPSIRLTGPKIHSTLTTAWYARRVEGRFERCLQRS